LPPSRQPDAVEKNIPRPPRQIGSLEWYEERDFVSFSFRHSLFYNHPIKYSPSAIARFELAANSFVSIGAVPLYSAARYGLARRDVHRGK
jgi:hypothetical protein